MSIDISKMPKLGFGMMRLPQNENKEIDLPQVCRMVDTYMKAGFNYFDTAYMYCDGRSESVVKEAVVKRYPRESFWLTTKLPQWMMNGIEDRDRIFNDQLERTGAGYFDLYLLHSVEDGANYEGYVKYDCFQWAMKKKEEGKIRHFGFSFHGTPELLDQILTEHPEVEIVQIQLNYIDWNNPLIQSGKLYEVLRRHNVPMLIMEPVKGGTLAQAAPEIEKLMKDVRPESSMASWALRFAASLDGVATVLSGMSDEAQMEDNLNTFQNFEPLTEKEQEVIREVVRAMEKMPTIPCTSCRYCVDGCPQSIQIPDVFRALNTLRSFGETDRAHNYYEKLVKNSGRAADCIACGQCESACPQHLPIIQLMEEASKELDPK